MYRINSKAWGEKAYKLRRKHDFTQLELAQQMGIQKATYSACERGTHNPGPNVFIGIQKIYPDLGDYHSLDWWLLDAEDKIYDDKDNHIKKLTERIKYLEDMLKAKEEVLASKEELISALRAK